MSKKSKERRSPAPDSDLKDETVDLIADDQQWITSAAYGFSGYALVFTSDCDSREHANTALSVLERPLSMLGIIAEIPDPFGKSRSPENLKAVEIRITKELTSRLGTRAAALFQFAYHLFLIGITKAPPSIDSRDQLADQISGEAAKVGFDKEKARSFVRAFFDARPDEWEQAVTLFADWLMFNAPRVIPSRKGLPHPASATLEWDVFISHATEDKDTLVRPLAETMMGCGMKVWYDEFTLKVGDSLRESIDLGLRHSRYGVVVISPSFLAKDWPKKELDALITLEFGGRKLILPVWHNIDLDGVRRFSPILASRLAVSSSIGVEKVASKLFSAMDRDFIAAKSRKILFGEE